MNGPPGTDAAGGREAPARGGRIRRALLPAALLGALVAAFYAPLLDRPFASEDYLLVRVLRERPPWSDPAEWLGGPWLGIEVVRFWRPVSTAFLAVEANLFGARPPLYNLAHLLLHAAVACLVWAVAVRVDRSVRPAGEGLGAAPLAAAVLFALHPLHPNAVSWIASFATPVGAALQLGALLAYARWREGGGRAALGAALGLFALALGSYEAAAVLPVLLAAWEHLVAGGRRHLRRAAAYLPFVALAAGYLLFRRLLFGETIGGYGGLALRFREAFSGTLPADLGTSLARLLVPRFDSPPPGWAPLGVVAVLVAGPALGLAIGGWRGVRARREVAAWLFGAAWTVLALAPFAFQPFVPGNGRYVYVASVGAALALGRLAAPPAARGTGRRVALAALPAAFAIAWAVLLAGSVRVHSQAGETARRVADALAARAGELGPGPVFVTGHPIFVENRAGVPLAQVLRYGLADAVRPPFRPTELVVHPLPLLDAADLGPVARGLPRAPRLRWDPSGQRFVAVEDPPAAGAEIEAWGPGEAPDGRGAALGAGEVAFLPPAGSPATAYRLIVSSRGNPAFVDLPPPEPGGSPVPVRGELPTVFVDSMRHLYGGELYWWIEGRDGAGRLAAWSPARPLPA